MQNLPNSNNSLFKHLDLIKEIQVLSKKINQVIAECNDGINRFKEQRKNLISAELSMIKFSNLINEIIRYPTNALEHIENILLTSDNLDNQILDSLLEQVSAFQAKHNPDTLINELQKKTDLMVKQLEKLKEFASKSLASTSKQLAKLKIEQDNYMDCIKSVYEVENSNVNTDNHEKIKSLIPAYYMKIVEESYNLINLGTEQGASIMQIFDAHCEKQNTLLKEQKICCNKSTELTLLIQAIKNKITDKKAELQMKMLDPDSFSLFGPIAWPHRTKWCDSKTEMDRK